MTWLLTGGAGYIGAHVARALLDDGIPTVVLDDLSSGEAARIPAGIPFVRASVCDRDRVLDTLLEHGVRGVVHLAAKKSVSESMARPLHYYDENVGGLVALLGAMGDAGVTSMVYSSSAAVIGTPDTDLVDEDTAVLPENPYGRSKLVCEWMLADAARIGAVRYIGLRYFNVAGAGAPDLGDSGAANLVPLVFAAIDEGRPAQVFGGDYPTRDGSGVRDYVHVVDIARAHVAAVRRLDGLRADEPHGRTFNVGRGEGVSVLEMLAAIEMVVGRDLAYEVIARRPGDPASVVGAVARIGTELGWKADLGLPEIISSAWTAWRHRQG